jgi:hypothetical protein
MIGSAILTYENNFLTYHDFLTIASSSRIISLDLLLRESFGLVKSTNAVHERVPHRASPKSALAEIARPVDHVPIKGA